MINISLHIQKLPPATLGVGGTLESNTQSAKICLNFNFWGEGGTLEPNTQSAKICLNFNFRRGGGTLESNTQSANICLNFNFQGEGEGGYSGAKYSKCQDLPKFQWGEGYSGVKYSKCQDLTKFQFWGGTQIYYLSLVYRNLLVHHR